jgi:hypothetical protein
MIDILGWFATLLVLSGYLLNAGRKHFTAVVVWLVGDVSWIIYDVYRGIYPHLALSCVIICINLYAIVNILKDKR